MNPLKSFIEKFSVNKRQRVIDSGEKSEAQSSGKDLGLKFRIGTTSGIYSAARSEELADIIGKLSYTLTRGASVLELASDVPHEVSYTQGKELRHIAGKQGVDITFHGSLTVQMGIPELIEWSSAQEHMQKSIKSAVHAGAKYVDFHSCLREWLELFTYAGSRLNIIMSDWEGRFIGELFKNNEKLAKWFVNDSRYRFWSQFGGVIVGQKLSLRIETSINEKIDQIIDEEEKILKDKLISSFKIEIVRNPNLRNQLEEELKNKGVSGEEVNDEVLKNSTVYSRWFDGEIEDLKRLSYHQKIGELTRIGLYGEDTDIKIREIIEDAREETIKEEIEEKLKKEGDWFEKERTGATLEMAYYIIAHELYINKEKYPIWDQMVNLYRKDLNQLGYHDYDPSKEETPNGGRELNWLEETVITIEERQDKELVKTFKEFYYGVVASKFLEGHMRELVRWMEKDLPSILEQEVKATEPNKDRVDEQIKKLKESLNQLAIAIENPDARDPSQGGRFLLWRPKQIYLAIKNIREKLKEEDKREHWDKIYMLMDFEHLATQGVDPLQELQEMTANPLTNDYGKYIKTVHAGVPTPLHSHKPISAEDREIVYRLLWTMKEAGLGSEHQTYLIFERGGFKDPFALSVRALKSMADLMNQNIKPENLPDEFFVVPKLQNVARQKVIIFEHTFDPIKGLLKFPEEEYTLLGSAAIKAGKRPEEWKKEELR
jgi:hypothetical protein